MSLTEQQRANRSASQRKYYHNPDNRLKDLARGAVCDAIRRGKLVRLACEECGSQKSQAHHEDYNNPLDVHWLCGKCHGAKHHKTHCVHGHEYTPENTYTRPNGKRHCRQCRAENMSQFQAARSLRGLDRT